MGSITAKMVAIAGPETGGPVSGIANGLFVRCNAGRTSVDPVEIRIGEGAGAYLSEPHRRE